MVSHSPNMLMMYSLIREVKARIQACCDLRELMLIPPIYNIGLLDVTPLMPSGVFLRHTMDIGIPGYPPTGTRETQVPAYVIPTGSATRGYGYGLSEMTGIPVYPSIYILYNQPCN